MYKELELNLGETYDREDNEALQDLLESSGLFKTDLLYRGIHGDKIRLTKEHGLDLHERDTLMALDHEEVYGRLIPHTTLFDYADFGDPSAIAVYDGSHFGKGDGLYVYPFNNPADKKSSLVAIVNLTW